MLVPPYTNAILKLNEENLFQRTKVKADRAAQSAERKQWLNAHS